MKMVQPLYEALLARAHDAKPHECVGMLLCDKDTLSDVVKAMVPLHNRSSEPEHSFFVDPYEQFTAEQAAERDGKDWVAVYHSHCNGPAAPSGQDLINAHPGKLMVIISCWDESIRVWRPNDGVLVEEDYELHMPEGVIVMQGASNAD